MGYDTTMLVTISCDTGIFKFNKHTREYVWQMKQTVCRCTGERWVEKILAYKMLFFDYVFTGRFSNKI